MEVQLTPDQKAFVRQAIETGRLQREEDAVKEALSLWEERERTRPEILAAVDEAEASLARGEGRAITGIHARASRSGKAAWQRASCCRENRAPLMGHFRTAKADSDLDDIWYYVATKSNSIDIADRFIDAIIDRFFLLAPAHNAHTTASLWGRHR